jgi:DNA-binding transcriptional regulator YhcF (GntR family)
VVEQQASGFDLSGIDLSVDRGYELPLGIQLAWKLRALIASGRIPAGERLPSVRELAKRADVNVNTIRAVYSRLEDDGFVETHHGRGTYAAQAPPDATDVERLASSAVADAVAEGIDPRDLATAIYAAAAPDVERDDDAEDRDDDDPPGGASGELPDPGGESDTAPVRRELRRQIAKLEGSLGVYPDSPPPVALNPALGPQPHIARTGELESTRNHLVDRVAELGALAEHRAATRDQARIELERMLADPRGHAWKRLSREQLGEPGCGHWHARPRLSVLGMLLGWWQVKVSSGCPLAGPPRRRPSRG